MTLYSTENFDENGIATPLPVMSEKDAGHCFERITRFRNSYPKDSDTALHIGPHYLFPWLLDIARSPAVIDPVSEILGPDLLIWGSQFFNKDADDGHYVSWHQDATYWGLEPHTVVAAWIAFSPSTPESGCMQVAPKTHRSEILPHKDTFGEGNLLSRGQEIAIDVSTFDTIDVILRPGEMSLHHVKLVHGSEPNRSDKARTGFVIRYIPTSVQQIGGRTNAVLAKGSDTYGHFDLVEPDPNELSARAWEQATEAKARTTSIIMNSAAQESVHATHRLG